MNTQVLDRRLQSVDVVGEASKAFVAVSAEQSAHLAGDMVVVDVQGLIPLMPLGGGDESTDGACAPLGGEHGLELFGCEFVFAESFFGSQSVDVGVTPDFVLGADLFPVLSVVPVGPFPLADGAFPPTAVCSDLAAAADDRDGLLASSAVSSAVGFVDVAESVLSHLFADASPTTCVQFDGDLATSSAGSGAVGLVEVAEPVFDCSWRVSLGVEHGLPFDPATTAMGVFGDPSRVPTSAVACPQLDGAVR